LKKRFDTEVSTFFWVHLWKVERYLLEDDKFEDIVEHFDSNVNRERLILSQYVARHCIAEEAYKIGRWSMNNFATIVTVQ